MSDKSKKEETALEVIKTTDTRHHAMQQVEPPGQAQMSEAGALVSQAMNQGLSMEHIQALLNMKRDEEDRAARKEYVAALSAAKAEFPVMAKGKRVAYPGKDGKPGTEFFHATLGQITSTITPILGRHGLSISWPSKRDKDRVCVCCEITHEGGHSERSEELYAPTDTTGSKGNLQAVGSTMTYLQRYTLTAALGLGFVDDDDGNAGSPPDPEPPKPETPEQAADREERDHLRSLPTRAQKTLAKLSLLGVTREDAEYGTPCGVGKPAEEWEDQDYQDLFARYSELKDRTGDDLAEAVDGFFRADGPESE